MVKRRVYSLTGQIDMQKEGETRQDGIVYQKLEERRGRSQTTGQFVLRTSS